MLGIWRLFTYHAPLVGYRQGCNMPRKHAPAAEGEMNLASLLISRRPLTEC